MLNSKIKEIFPDVAIMKSQDNESAFVGRNLPSFVKDYLVRKHLTGDGLLDREAVENFLNEHLPEPKHLRSKLMGGGNATVLTRFIVQYNIAAGTVNFAIPDAGIKSNEGVIPDYVLADYRKKNDDIEFGEGEKWGVIKLIYNQPGSPRERGHIELAEYKPFRPYRVDLDYFRNCRRQFTTEEWIDVLLSAMEYNPDAFNGIVQKLEFLSRLLVFVEPRLNMIELAPKGTAKSYVFGNLSKYGWLVSGGKVSRAKLFYDKSKQLPGIMRNYDFTAFDEIQTISFSDPSEVQAILKSYLESGKATVDNYEFMSECGLMLMGNIPLSEDNRPLSRKYFSTLPEIFCESALLDRFHGFIEGWKLPRMNKEMVLRGWTLNVEYFSEILHALRTVPEYAALVNEIILSGQQADLRDLKAVKRLATAYSKLLFPHISAAGELNPAEFNRFCLQPAIHRRGIIKEQCHAIDPEFKETMPEIRLR